jgi:predicted amidohydrolase
MSFQIALVQFDPVRKNVKSNIEKIKSLLDGIKADLIVLPELSNTGYMYSSIDDLSAYSESKAGKGEFLSALHSLAMSSQGLVISGYAELENGRLYNSAAAVSTDGVIGNYRKVHLYSNEKDLFEPGNQGYTVVEWKKVKIGLMICFDWIFPEAARTLSLAGAQIIAHPANLVLPYCQDAMVTRSLENRVFTITANRIGKEKLGKDTLHFTGESQMTSPDGKILFRGPRNKPTVHTESINPEKALDKSVSKRNDLFLDRRMEYYQLDLN